MAKKDKKVTDIAVDAVEEIVEEVIDETSEKAKKVVKETAKKVKEGFSGIYAEVEKFVHVGTIFSIKGKPKVYSFIETLEELKEKIK
jgi:hypothetical protein